VKSIAYNGVTLLWIMYLSRRREPVAVVEVMPELNALNLALIASTPGREATFLAMVEQAVDRVLSRNSWPRTTTNGSEIVVHKPEPEERN
jgi:hypothetical protein